MLTENPSQSHRRLPLDALHRQAGATMGQFGHWEVPLYYTSIIDEHHQVRRAAGVFDISHMGEIEVSGSDGEAFLEASVPRKVTSMFSGKARYMPLLNPRGGIVDDIILYKISEETFLFIVNAESISRDWNWMNQALGSFSKSGVKDVRIRNLSAEKGLLAVQGPESGAIVSQLFGKNFLDLPYYSFMTHQEALIARTGYTGELGYEIMTPLKDLPGIWEQLRSLQAQHSIKPVGFGARDTLRLEAGMALYGHEMNEETDPVSSGIGWAVDWDKDCFIGKEALGSKKTKSENQIVGFEMLDRGIARAGFFVEVGGKQIGEVTSGAFSPTLKKNIGFALVQNDFTELGTEWDVVVRNKRLKAKVVKTPFYQKKKS